MLKQKNVLSKEAYAEKVKMLGKKINELKSKQANEAKKFEIALKNQQTKYKVLWLMFCQLLLIKI